MYRYRKMDLMKISPVVNFTILTQSLGIFSLRVEKLLRIETNDLFKVLINETLDLYNCGT